MTVEPFKRITKVTQDIANNWQKYYVCTYQAERVKAPFCGVILESRGEFDSWTRLLQDTWQLSCEVFYRQFGTPDDDNSMPSAAIYASGWVLIERKDSVEVGVLVDRNEEHKTQLEITTKISHLATGQLVGNTFTARLNEQIEMETPECRIKMIITQVPMEGCA